MLSSGVAVIDDTAARSVERGNAEGMSDSTRQDQTECGVGEEEVMAKRVI